MSVTHRVRRYSFWEVRLVPSSSIEFRSRLHTAATSAGQESFPKGEDADSRLQNDRAAVGRVLGALVAVVALAVGVLCYVLDRAPSSAPFLPAAWSLADGASFFGPLGGVLPDFVHPYAFSLLTASVLGTSQRQVLVSCATWWGIDSLFELGQLPNIGPHVATIVPSLFSGIPFLKNIAPYFLNGTFDPWDLVAIALGGLAALGTLALIHCEDRD